VRTRKKGPRKNLGKWGKGKLTLLQKKKKKAAREKEKKRGDNTKGQASRHRTRNVTKT